VWIPRWENSVDLSPTQVVLAGVSGAFGSNETGADSRTQIYGGDFLYKWKSANAEGGFPFVKWQTEFMYRRFEAGRGMNESFSVAETFHDWGMYSQVLWDLRKDGSLKFAVIISTWRIPGLRSISNGNRVGR